MKNALNTYPQLVCKREFQTQRFKRFNERPAEFAFIFNKLAEIYPRRVLDVGTGTTALPHLMRNCGFLVTATDNIRDYWPSGMFNRHYHVIDDDITNTRLTGEFDLITCVSVLEHVKDSDAALRNMLRLLRIGGYLALTFPYKETDYVENVYELPGSCYGQHVPYVTQSFSRKQLEGWFSKEFALIDEQEYWQYWTGEYWTIGEQIIPPKKVAVEDNHQLTCILVRKLA